MVEGSSLGVALVGVSLGVVLDAPWMGGFASEDEPLLVVITLRVGQYSRQLF